MLGIERYRDAIWHYQRFIKSSPETPARIEIVQGFIAQMQSELEQKAKTQPGLSVFEQRRVDHPCIVVAPQLPLGETWGGSWYGGETAGQRMLVAAVRALRERSSVDPRRVYGVGFSMGAIGLCDILVRHADLFTAAVLVAGDLDLAQASSLTSFPLWSVVGGRDELVPPDNTRAFAHLSEARGGLAKVTEIASAGHDVWRIAFAHAPLWDWLFTHEATPP